MFYCNNFFQKIPCPDDLEGKCTRVWCQFYHKKIKKCREKTCKVDKIELDHDANQSTAAAAEDEAVEINYEVEDKLQEILEGHSEDAENDLIINEEIISKPLNSSEYNDSTSDGNIIQSDTLKGIIVDAVKNVFNESFINSNIDSEAILKHFDANEILNEALTSLNSNESQIPSYNPTPINLLNSRNLQVPVKDSTSFEEYSPTTTKVAVNSLVNKPKDDEQLTDFSNDDDSDDVTKTDFDMMEDLLVHSSSNYSDKDMKKRKRALGKSTVIHHASRSSEDITPNYRENCNDISNYLENINPDDFVGAYLPEKSIEKSDFKCLPSVSETKAEVKSGEEIIVKVEMANEQHEKNLEKVTGGKSPQQLISSTEENKNVSTATHSLLPKIAHLSRPDVKSWCPVAKSSSQLSVEKILNQLPVKSTDDIEKTSSDSGDTNITLTSGSETVPVVSDTKLNACLKNNDDEKNIEKIVKKELKEKDEAVKSSQSDKGLKRKHSDPEKSDDISGKKKCANSVKIPEHVEANKKSFSLESETADAENIEKSSNEIEINSRIVPTKIKIEVEKEESAVGKIVTKENGVASKKQSQVVSRKKSLNSVCSNTISLESKKSTRSKSLTEVSMFDAEKSKKSHHKKHKKDKESSRKHSKRKRSNKDKHHSRSNSHRTTKSSHSSSKSKYHDKKLKKTKDSSKDKRDQTPSKKYKNNTENKNEIKNSRIIKDSIIYHQNKKFNEIKKLSDKLDEEDMLSDTWNSLSSPIPDLSSLDNIPDEDWNALLNVEKNSTENSTQHIEKGKDQFTSEKKILFDAKKSSKLKSKSKKKTLNSKEHKSHEFKCHKSIPEEKPDTKNILEAFERASKLNKESKININVDNCANLILLNSDSDSDFIDSMEQFNFNDYNITSGSRNSNLKSKVEEEFELLKDVKKETDEDTLVTTKQRIANPGAFGNLIPRAKALVKPRRKTPSEIMLERYKKLKEQQTEIQKRLEQQENVLTKHKVLNVKKESAVLNKSNLDTHSSLNTTHPSFKSESDKTTPYSKFDTDIIDLIPTSTIQKKRVARVPKNVSAMLKTDDYRSKRKEMTQSSRTKERFSSQDSNSNSRNINASDLDISAGPSTKIRVAHVPDNVETLSRPVVNVANGTKVPQTVRQRYLNCFVDETLKFCDAQSKAFQVAVAEEFICHKKAANRMVYLNLAVNIVKKLRSGQVSTEAREYISENPEYKTSITTVQPNLLKVSKKSTTAQTHSVNPNHRKVSHFDVMAAGGEKGTWSIKKQNKDIENNLVGALIGAEFYKNLTKYILLEEELKTYGYPRPDDSELGKAVIQCTKFNQKKMKTKLDEKICDRCHTVYQVDEFGFPTKISSCVYHWGRSYKRRTFVGWETKFNCCSSDSFTDGCCVGSSHVPSQDYDGETTKGFVKTLPKAHGADENFSVYSLDCEMCYTTAGSELTRITIINSEVETVYEAIVKPNNPIIDYNTRFSGITEETMLGKTVTIEQVQQVILSKFSDKTILIGHSLESDFVALKLIHDTVVDTSIVFPHRLGAPYKRALRNLAADFLSKIIQNDVDGHDSAEDAITCMELMRMKIREDVKVKLQSA